MSKSRKRLPLKPSVARSKINGVAWDLNWLFVDVVQEKDGEPYEKIYTTPDSKTRIHYVEDSFIGVHYVLAAGPSANAVVDTVADRLEAYDWDDVDALFSLDRATDDRVEAVYVAAILAPREYDADVFAFFERASDDDDEQVRLAVSMAIGYVGWEACRQIAQTLMDDSSERIRKNARLMDEGFEMGLHES